MRWVMLVGAAVLMATGTGIVQSAAHAAAARTVRVSGSVPVAYVTSKSNPDAGLSYRFTGKGRVHPFGMVRIRGTAQSPGFIREAIPVGEFRFVNQQGSVTLRLVYPKTPGFAPLPSHGTFLIVDATGAYAGDSGGGTFASVLGHAICNAASLITHLRCRGTGTFHFTGST
jgi:hypothetical protein